jgi:hypothetical protein
MRHNGERGCAPAQRLDVDEQEVAMTTDAWLAIAHHLAVFSLAAVIAAEWPLVRRGMAAADIRRLGRVDPHTASSQWR